MLKQLTQPHKNNPFNLQYDDYKGKLNNMINNALMPLGQKLSNFKFSKIHIPKLFSNTNNPTVFDWIFFPIWSSEQTIYGSFISMPLDLLNTFLNNVDLILDTFEPIFDRIKDIIIDTVGLAEGILPGGGDAIVAENVIGGMIDDFLKYILKDGIEILQFFLNVSRKKWSLAFLNLMDIIPNLDAIVNGILSSLISISHFTDNLADTSNKVNLVRGWEPLITLLIDNSKNFLNPDALFLNPDAMKILNKYPKIKTIFTNMYSKIKNKKTQLKKVIAMGFTTVDTLLN